MTENADNPSYVKAVYAVPSGSMTCGHGSAGPYTFVLLHDDILACVYCATAAVRVEHRPLTAADMPAALPEHPKP